MFEDIDKLIEEIEAEKKAKHDDMEVEKETLVVDDETAERLKRERKTKASGFELNLNLDDLQDDQNTGQ